jgi:serine/threonine-protein kinase
VSDILPLLRAALADRYDVERQLGQGGTATVYRATDIKHQRPVAIKVLIPELAHVVGTDRFLREIQIAAGLSHPHILPVFDSGASGGLVYYVMPYVRGESLRDRLSRERQLGVGQALRIAREIADALDYAHRQGIVHRDIKPENVLLEDGHAVVADFGVARALVSSDGGRLTQTGLAVGTPAYMSPEQSSGEANVDGRTDVYALGCVLYEMLAGVPPFQGPSLQSLLRQHLTETPRRLAVLRPEVPEGIQRALERALAKTPADRFATAADFARALEHGAAATAKPRRGRRVWLVAGAAAAAAVALLTTLVGRRAPATLDGNLVAVAPFDVFVPSLGFWREGLVDVLSRDLDGAGPIRTVAPTVVVRRWRGRADAPSAAALGRGTGARLTLFGQVLRAGADSVRVSATLYDVNAARSMGDFEVTDRSDRIDRVADSLTMAVLRELSRTRPIGAVRLASLGSSSLPALKAFLQGEQFYRRTDWDSAMAYYERAINLDSTFALAMRRIGLALGWQRGGFDSLSRVYHLRAGRFNRGLAPRESLLVTADSLSAAVYEKGHEGDWWSQSRRLFATLEEATRRYPGDPEVWYALGDAQYHFAEGPRIGMPERAVLATFDRAIALDSSFGPAYIHPVQLGFSVGGYDLGMRYASAYLALDPKDLNAQGVRLIVDLLAASSEEDKRRVLDRASNEQLIHAWNTVFTWPDSAETAAAVARERVERGADAFVLGGALLYRGHLREARRAIGNKGRPLLAEVALGGAIPPDSAAALFGRWLRRDTVLAGGAVRFWIEHRDTAALRDFVRLADAIAKGLRPPMLQSMSHTQARAFGGYLSSSARAYLALARGDTSQALARLLSLPDTLCPMCDIDRLTTAQLLSARGRNEEAGNILNRGRYNAFSMIESGVWQLERGRVNERLGRTAEAVEAYRFVADVWHDPDPELEPLVAEAHEALERLSEEPPR